MAYTVISIGIVLVLRILYPLFFPSIVKAFKIYGETYYVITAVVDALFITLDIVTFGMLSRLLRGNKRLFVPLLFYLVMRLLSGIRSICSLVLTVKKDVSAAFFTSPAVSLLFSFLIACSIAFFLLAFIKHPKKSVRVGAMCSLAGYCLSFVSVIVNTLALPILRNILSPFYIPFYNYCFSMLFSLLQLVFWVALSVSLLRQNRGI